MAKPNKELIYFIDDEEGIRKSVSSSIETVGYSVECFANGEDCIKRLKTKVCNLVISDVRMPVMDGFTLLEEIKKAVPWVPTILVTGYGDVQMAVQAMKMGAADFIEKPFGHDSLLEKIEQTLRKDNFENCSLGQNLTNSEKKVLKLLMKGMSNKEIALCLNRSVRTIEMHRSNTMRKFKTDNIVNLVKKSTKTFLV